MVDYPDVEDPIFSNSISKNVKLVIREFVKLGIREFVKLVIRELGIYLNLQILS